MSRGSPNPARQVREYIRWSPLFSVSVPELDADHRRLFGIVNEFFQLREEGHGNEQVFYVLNRLVEYTEQHFAREERLMERAHFPAYHQHRLEHERLLQQVFRIHGTWEEGGEGVDAEVMAFLQTWLQNHIMEFDKAYQSHLGSAIPPE